MQSLKDLRKASAAAVRQRSRTGDAAGSELTSSVELGEAPGPVAGTTTTTAEGVSRIGRTLAPLTSAGSLVQGTGRDDPSSDVASNIRDDTHQDDREMRRRRRRRRREREHRRGDSSSRGVNEDAASASVVSRSSTAVVGEEASVVASAGEEGFRGGGLVDGRSEEDTSRERAAEEDALDKNATGPGPPFSARGLPPQERPLKKLSPLEARRARIEQQKREEVGYCAPNLLAYHSSLKNSCHLRYHFPSQGVRSSPVYTG